MRLPSGASWKCEKCGSTEHIACLDLAIDNEGTNVNDLKDGWDKLESQCIEDLKDDTSPFEIFQWLRKRFPTTLSSTEDNQCK